MNIRDFLDNSYKLNHSIQAKKEILNTIEENISITTDTALLKKLKDEHKKLKNAINDEIRTQMKAIELIEKLEDAILRSVLEYKYICCLNVEAIADKLHYSTRHIVRMHSKAVEELKKYYKSA